MTGNLTHAAGQLLEEHLNELRQRVIREASSHGTGSPGVAETRAAIHRIAVADRLLPHTVFELVSLLTRPRFAVAYIALTLSTAVAALVTGTEPVGGAMIGAVLGAAVTLAGYLLVGHRRTRSERSRRAKLEATSDFLRQMSQLEGQLRAVCPQRHSLRQALVAITHGGWWAEGDVTAFGNLLKLRNGIVHQQEIPPSKADLMAMQLRVGELAALLKDAKPVELPRPR